jgi:hypothetical protein
MDIAPINERMPIVPTFITTSGSVTITKSRYHFALPTFEHTQVTELHQPQ